tara:strand:+ start:153 stop:866 length:714 start_codon:yes stop_codon:yes gene_type:complete
MATSNLIFTTPVGTAQYPWLTKPDTKFSETGHFKVDLVLSKEKALPIIKQINDVFLENLKEETKKAKGKEVNKAKPPFSEELDEEGKATGNIILRFKSKGEYKPALFDSKASPIDDVNVWSGSEIKVNGSIAPYYTSLIGAGVSLRLRAVQIINLVEGGRTAGGYGFDEQEGYEHKASETTTASAPDAFKNEESDTIDEPVIVSKPEATEEPTPVKKETPKSTDGGVSLDDLVSDWS